MSSTLLTDILFFAGFLLTVGAAALLGVRFIAPTAMGVVGVILLTIALARASRQRTP